MTTPNPLRHVRWAWTLPLVVLAANASLMVLAIHQNAAFVAAHPGAAIGELQAPATLLAQVLDGPGFFLPSPFGPLDADWIRLPGVVLFWAWLGRGLDRKLCRVRPGINRSGFRRGVFCAAMFGLALLFTWGFLRFLHRQSMLPTEFVFHNFLWNVPWWIKLRLVELGWYVGLAWSAVYVFYFGSKLISILRPGHPSGNQLNSVSP